MAYEENRMEKILPILKERTERKIEEFSEAIPWEKMIKPFLRPIENKEKRKEAQKVMKKVFRTVFPVALRPFFEMNEMSSLAKVGASNMLQAMGYNPKIDEPLKGFSGNKYTISVVAPTDERLLIVDQMMLSSKLIIPWLKVQMPKTFDSYKVTIADFFKYLDISMGLAKPSIYWLHDYEVSQQLADEIGFSFKRMMKDIAFALGRIEGIPEEKIEKEMIGDEDFKEIMKMFDTSMADFFGGIGEVVLKTTVTSTFPFSLKRAANRFCIPCIPMQLLDMLEASILDPKSPFEARTLKGYAFELGLLDFLNPPWPDYVLELARSQKSVPFGKVGEILGAAETVGHKARLIKELYVNPIKLKDDPADGLEVLKQNNLVTIEAKETYKITPGGREYIKEVRKRPRKHALRKAMEYIRSHVSINIPPFTFKGKKKDKDEE